VKPREFFDHTGEGRAVLVFPGGLVFIEVLSTDAGIKERIALQIQDLTAVRFGDAGIANKHGVVSQTVGYCWRIYFNVPEPFFLA